MCPTFDLPSLVHSHLNVSFFTTLKKRIAQEMCKEKGTVQASDLASYLGSIQEKLSFSLYSCPLLLLSVDTLLRLDVRCE